MNASTISRSASVRSQTGVFVRTSPLACFWKLASHDRYLGLVHGSTAPSASDKVRSGITRSMSKSMVLPKPWHRGQAPKGELKLNRMGSGTANSRPQVLHWNFSLKRSEEHTSELQS